jgi:hypothetical protein
MAASAQLRNVLSLNLTLPPSLLAHGLACIVNGWVASVTTGARQTFLKVDVLTKRFMGHTQRIGKNRMTISAGVLGLSITQAHGQRDGAYKGDMAKCTDKVKITLQNDHRHSTLPHMQAQDMQGR